jgi:hypothetical protein
MVNDNYFSLVKPDDRLNRFALGEVIAERRKRTVGVLGQVLGLEPIF